MQEKNRKRHLLKRSRGKLHFRFWNELERRMNVRGSGGLEESERGKSCEKRNVDEI